MIACALGFLDVGGHGRDELPSFFHLRAVRRVARNELEDLVRAAPGSLPCPIGDATVRRKLLCMYVRVSWEQESSVISCHVRDP